MSSANRSVDLYLHLQLIERRNQEPLETVSLSGPVTETWNAVRKFIGGNCLCCEHFTDDRDDL